MVVIDGTMTASKEVIFIDSSDEEEDAADVTGQFEFVINGKPLSMPRPNFISWLKNGKLLRRVVNKAAPLVKGVRELFIRDLNNNYNKKVTDLPLFPEEAIFVEMEFYRRPSNGMFIGNKRSRGLRSMEQHPDNMVPDIDNMVKFYLDAMDGVFFSNDKQVCRIIATKMVDTLPPHDGKVVIFCRKFMPHKDSGRFPHGLPQGFPQGFPQRL